MSQVGVVVQANEVPPATTTTYSTANAFIVGVCDWGPVGTPIKVTSLANAASLIGTPNGSGSPYGSRSNNNAAVFDALDELFHEDGSASPIVYISRVVHGTAASASLVLQDGSGATSLTLTAKYAGEGGNGIYVSAENNTSTYTLSLADANGNTLAQSPTLSTLAAGVTWAGNTGLLTAEAGAGDLPDTLTATALTGGTNGSSDATLSDWTAALNVFGPTLGPGQVLAPGQTDTTLTGIWSALGAHAAANNRVAVCSMDDNQSASTLAGAIGEIGSSAVGSYCGFWAGNRNIPGVATGTTRSISPDSVIAGLCARVDNATGNPNQAAAGVNYPLQYATAPTSMVSGAPLDTYSLADLSTLNDSGINTFQNVNGLPCNYGFVSSELSSSDSIYWQFNHARLRMAIVAQAQLVGQPFVFSQIDGQGSQATAFKSALTAMLTDYYTLGALYGATAADAFTVDTGSDVNTPATIAAGQLNAVLTVAFSYFAQAVNIQINVVPITQAI